MADTPIPPYRCTYCLQALPADHSQALFGSEFLRPKSDEPETFVAEAEKILHYAAAVATVNHQTTISEDVTSELNDLVAELIDEALRRLERASDAFHILLMRKPSAVPPAGRAS